MAEALTRAALAEAGVQGVTVSSAGTDAFTGDPASANARAVMRERGLDLDGHRARRVDRQVIEDADLILTMTSRHKDRLVRLVPRAIEKTFTLREFASGEKLDVSDPFGQSVESYRKTAEELANEIARLVQRLSLNQRQGNPPDEPSSGEQSHGGMRL